MNKKGFTLIELIISLVIITLIGSTTTIALLKKDNNKDLKKVENKVFNAANVYIATEKDSLGNTYENGIANYGVGLQLSVNELINSGYLEKKVGNELATLTNLDKNDLFILLSNTISSNILSEEQCKGDNGVIEFTTSWDSNNEKKYLCAPSINEKPKSCVSVDGKVVCTIDLYNLLKLSSNCYTYDNNQTSVGDNNIKYGLCNIDESNYYYTGTVNNNFIRFKDSNTLFRIVKTVDKTQDESKTGYIQLVSTNTVNNVYGSGYKAFFAKDLGKEICYTPHWDYSGRYCASIEINKSGEITLDVIYRHPGGSDDQKYNFKKTFTNWSTNDTTCGSLKCQNYVYLTIYEPLYNWFNNSSNFTDKDRNIVQEYNWCINYQDCDYKINSKFATMSKADYSNIINDNYDKNNNSWNTYTNVKFFDKDFTMDSAMMGHSINEVTFDSLAKGLSFPLRGAYDSSIWNASTIKLRPTFMVKDAVNILSGDGTENNPYVIDTN